MKGERPTKTNVSRAQKSHNAALISLFTLTWGLFHIF